MKLPFVSRKKYDDLKNKNIKAFEELFKERDDLYFYLDTLQEDVEGLSEDVIRLKCRLKVKNKELYLAKQYNDISTNKVCELNTKLIAATTKNEELEAKIKDLEFCLEEAKKENRKSLEIIKRTNIVKNLLINLTTLKDIQGRILVENGSILTQSKVEGNKVYDIARLLG